MRIIHRSHRAFWCIQSVRYIEHSQLARCWMCSNNFTQKLRIVFHNTACSLLSGRYQEYQLDFKMPQKSLTDNLISLMLAIIIPLVIPITVGVVLIIIGFVISCVFSVILALAASTFLGTFETNLEASLFGSAVVSVLTLFCYFFPDLLVSDLTGEWSVNSMVLTWISLFGVTLSCCCVMPPLTVWVIVMVTLITFGCFWNFFMPVVGVIIQKHVTPILLKDFLKHLKSEMQ